MAAFIPVEGECVTRAAPTNLEEISLLLGCGINEGVTNDTVRADGSEWWARLTFIAPRNERAEAWFTQRSPRDIRFRGAVLVLSAEEAARVARPGSRGQP